MHTGDVPIAGMTRHGTCGRTSGTGGPSVERGGVRLTGSGRQRPTLNKGKM